MRKNNDNSEQSNVRKDGNLHRVGLVSCLMTAVTLFCLAPEATALSRVPYLGIVGKGRANLLKAGVRTAYAVGDFNGDGIKDLAVGIPYASIADRRAAGKVVLIPGDNSGLSNERIEYYQGASNANYRMPGALEAGDLTGFSLAAGDFNGDGIDDLAVGAPGEDLDGIEDSGVVFIGLGQRRPANGNGIAGLNFMTLGAAYRQDGVGSFSLPDRPHTGDMLGFSLAAGNFNGDQRNGRPLMDLAIGIPGEDVRRNGEEQRDAGAVAIIQGTANGPDASVYTSLFTRNGEGRFDLYGTPHRGEMLGFSLAAGNFNGDLSMSRLEFDDLAIGSPGREIDGKENAGSVCIALGSGAGLDARLVDGEFSQTSEGRFDLRGGATADERTGFALAAGDFDGDGYDDLAIGAPGETVGGHPSAGAVMVARGGAGSIGSNTGLTGLWYLGQFTRSSSDSRYDLPGTAHAGDMVGFSLAADDFNYTARYPRADLAIGAPGADGDAGAVFVKFGSGTGGIASSAVPRYFSQSGEGADNLYGVAESGDLLGLSVAAGAIGAGQSADLFIAVPGETNDNPDTQGFPDAVFDDPVMADSRQMLVDGFTEVLNGDAEFGPVPDNDAYFQFKRHGFHIWISPRRVMAAMSASVTALANSNRARVRSENYWVEPYPPGVDQWWSSPTEDALRGEVDLEVVTSVGNFDAHVSIAVTFSSDQTDLLGHISYISGSSLLGSSKTQSALYAKDTVWLYPRWIVLLPDGGLELVL